MPTIHDLIYDVIGLILKLGFLALVGLFVVELSNALSLDFADYLAAILGLTIGNLLHWFQFKLP